MNRAYSPMVEDVLAWLRGGELRVGDKLPTENELRDRYGISITSVRKGIDLLVEKDVVTRRQGSGTYVTRTLPATSRIRRDTVLLGWEWDYVAYHPYFTEMLRGVRGDLARVGLAAEDMFSHPDRSAADGWIPTTGAHYRDPKFAAWQQALSERQDVAGLVVSAALAERLHADMPEALIVAMGVSHAVPHVAYNWLHEVSRAIAATLETGAAECLVVSSHPADFLALAVRRAKAMADSTADVRIVRIAHTRLTSQAMRRAGDALADTFRADSSFPDAVVLTDEWTGQCVLDLMAESEKDFTGVPIVCIASRESRLRSSLPLSRLLADGHAAGVAASALLQHHLQSPHDAPRHIVLSCYWEHDARATYTPIRAWDTFESTLSERG